MRDVKRGKFGGLRSLSDHRVPDIFPGRAFYGLIDWGCQNSGMADVGTGREMGDMFVLGKVKLSKIKVGHQGSNPGPAVWVSVIYQWLK